MHLGLTKYNDYMTYMGAKIVFYKRTKILNQANPCLITYTRVRAYNDNGSTVALSVFEPRRVYTSTRYLFRCLCTARDELNLLTYVLILVQRTCG